MKFQIMSDSHMQVEYGLGNEYGKFDFPVAAPNLVLLGGMGRVCDQELLDFIVVQLARFERVFYAMGRDELYGGTYEEARELMKAFAEQLTETPPTENADGEPIAKLGEFHYLHRRRVDIGDVTVLGCSLWSDKTNIASETRARAGGPFRPIKEFFAEEEMAEREGDLNWLEAQLDACANGETLPPTTDAINTPKENPAQAEPEEEEGDIYNDTEPSPAPQPTEPKLGVEQMTNNTAASPTAPHPRQGPPRRVVIFTSHPPTYNTTTHRLWVPHHADSKPVETLLQDRQCWVPDGSNNGVFIDSSVHGNDTRNANESVGNDSSKGDGHANADTVDVDVASTTSPSCCHGSGDASRPPGIAAWAFGNTGWSCDVQYNTSTAPAPDVKGKKKVDEPLPKTQCPSCKRVLAPIRMVSNQRGQRWKRNPILYIDVPAGWRAFDEALVLDV